MSRMKEINKLIYTKIKNTKTSTPEVQDFLLDVLSFERDYLNEDMNRFSAQYKKYIEYYSRKIQGGRQ